MTIFMIRKSMRRIDDMKYVYNPKEVSDITGINAQKIRVNMANGNWDLGAVITNANGSKDYMITPYKIFKQLGIILPGFEPPENYSEGITKLIEAIAENTKAIETLIAFGK